MTNYDNTNSGVLFNARDRKQKETDRDYNGNVEVKCPHCGQNSEHWLSAWINTSAKGDKYMKLKLNPKESQPSGGYDKNPDGTTKPPENDDFDDIPF